MILNIVDPTNVFHLMWATAGLGFIYIVARLALASKKDR